MTSYTLSGTVKSIFDPQTFSRGFTKRDFVVTTDEERPQDIKLECVAEWCSLLDRVQPADRVRVTFRLRGNEYKDRYFVNLQAYQIDKLDADGGATTIEAVPPDEPDALDDPFDPEPF